LDQKQFVKKEKCFERATQNELLIVIQGRPTIEVSCVVKAEQCIYLMVGSGKMKQLPQARSVSVVLQLKTLLQTERNDTLVYKVIKITTSISHTTFNFPQARLMLEDITADVDKQGFENNSTRIVEAVLNRWIIDDNVCRVSTHPINMGVMHSLALQGLLQYLNDVSNFLGSSSIVSLSHSIRTEGDVINNGSTIMDPKNNLQQIMATLYGAKVSDQCDVDDPEKTKSLRYSLKKNLDSHLDYMVSNWGEIRQIFSGVTALGETALGETASGEKDLVKSSSGETALGELASGEKSSRETASGETALGVDASGEMASGEKVSGKTASREVK